MHVTLKPNAPKIGHLYHNPDLGLMLCTAVPGEAKLQLINVLTGHKNILTGNSNLSNFPGTESDSWVDLGRITVSN